MLFLDGLGGTGKIYFVNDIQNCLKAWRKKFIAVVTFAVAAKILKNGRTAHSTFKILVQRDVEYTCFIFVSSDEARSLRAVSLIIWDEMVMCRGHCIEPLNLTLQDVTKKITSVW